EWWIILEVFFFRGYLPSGDPNSLSTWSCGMDGFKEGFAKEATDNVEQLTGHPARSIETFASDFAGFFGGG
ncbi:MAG: hypothetical protein O7D33_01565, partial [Chloroflexi bacterium]|nr:hypothetical protein [Chloroflexota bacterium]